MRSKYKAFKIIKFNRNRKFKKILNLSFNCKIKKCKKLMKKLKSLNQKLNLKFKM